MKYLEYVSSKNSSKVTSADTATRNFHLRNFGDEPIEVAINSRGFPSGPGTARPEVPFSVGSLKSTLAAAYVRVAQFESALVDEALPSADVRLIIAQENGLTLNLGRNRQGRRSLGVYDHAVAVVKDLDSGNTFAGVSSGARLPTLDFVRDVVRTALKPGGFENNSIADTYSKRMARRGVLVDKQNPHKALGYPPREVFILEATEKAMEQLPLPKRN